MAHAYPGNPVYPTSITIPDDGDLDAAAAYAVAFEQLADRCAALTGGGVGGSFLNPTLTNATFHGNTQFLDGPPSGSLYAAVNSIDFESGGFIEMSAVDTMYFNSGSSFTIESGAALLLSGSSYVQLMGGIVEVSSSLVSIGNPGTAVTIYASDASITATTLDIPDATAITLPNSGTIITSSAELWQNGFTNLAGVVCYHSVNRSVGDSSLVAGNTSVFTYILPDPGLITGFNLDHAGAQLGQRVRFNAQQATGVNHWVLVCAGKTWHLRNAATYTVAIEFVSNGSAWIVDQWEQGGVGSRNGF